MKNIDIKISFLYKIPCQETENITKLLIEVAMFVESHERTW